MKRVIKSKKVIFRLTPDEKMKLKETAGKQGISISEFLRNSFVL